MLININKSLYHCKLTIIVGFKKKLNRFVTVLLYANNYIVYASSSSSSFSSSPSPRKGKIVIKGKDFSKRRVGEGGC